MVIEISYADSPCKEPLGMKLNVLPSSYHPKLPETVAPSRIRSVNAASVAVWFMRVLKETSM